MPFNEVNPAIRIRVNGIDEKQATSINFEGIDTDDAEFNLTGGNSTPEHYYLIMESFLIGNEDEIEPYTDEMAQDAVGNSLLDTSTIDWTYDPNTSISADLIQSGIIHQSISGSGTNTHSQIDSHIASTSNPHNLTKAQIGLGNVENTTLSTWTGSANLTTLGTISTGTIPIANVINANSPLKGGTGSSTLPSNGQILIGNGTNFVTTGITAGSSKMTIVNTAGGIELVGSNVFDPTFAWAWGKSDGTIPASPPIVSSSPNSIAIGWNTKITGGSKSHNWGYNNLGGGTSSAQFGGESRTLAGTANVSVGQGTSSGATNSVDLNARIKGIETGGTNFVTTIASSNTAWNLPRPSTTTNTFVGGPLAANSSTANYNFVGNTSYIDHAAKRSLVIPKTRTYLNNSVPIGNDITRSADNWVVTATQPYGVMIFPLKGTSVGNFYSELTSDGATPSTDNRIYASSNFSHTVSVLGAGVYHLNGIVTGVDIVSHTMGSFEVNATVKITHLAAPTIIYSNVRQLYVDTGLNQVWNVTVSITSSTYISVSGRGTNTANTCRWSGFMKLNHSNIIP